MSWTALGAADLPDPRTFAPEELNAILAAHEDWLVSEGIQGARADLRRGLLRGLDLSGVDLRKAWLRGATLSEVNLSGARMAGADLTGCDLTDANLTGAALRGADLRDADLAGTALRDADLQDADLRDVKGLTGGQFGGSDVAGAKLPDAIVKFEGLTNVQETSKGAQGLFTSIMLLSGYTWLTVIATRDNQLFNRAAPTSSRLPILGTEIPLAQLYTVMPLLLLGFYVYFLLYLQRLWEELTDLPAVFPDGRPLDRKAYPWLLNGLVRIHFLRLSGHQTPLTNWQARTSAGVAWGLVPCTLLLIWSRYLRSHDWWVTGIHVWILSLAVGAGVAFYRLAVNTLRAGRPTRFTRQKRWGRFVMNTRVFATTVALAVSVVLLVLSQGAIRGVNTRLLKSGVAVTATTFHPTDFRVWVPQGLGFLGVRSFAALDETDLSTRPANWSGKDIELVKGADLGGRDLRFADAYAAFFVNAYLRDTDLRGADLRDADLRGANLKRANLLGANLRGAKLGKADLRGAILDLATLKDVDLTDAVLDGARLRKADLTGADLSRADLTDTDLQGAILVDANLQGAALVGAKMRGADLTGARLRADEPAPAAPPLQARGDGKKPEPPLPPPAVMAPNANSALASPFPDYRE